MTTTQQPICPHCGYSLHRDEPIERDGWRLHATRGVTAPGKVRLPFKRIECEVLVALAEANGHLLEWEVCERTGVASGNTVKVHMTRIRRTCEAAGVAVPFKSLGYGRGWAWSV